MTKSSGVRKHREPGGSSFGDRLRFVIWLSGLRLGVESAKELAAVLGKGASQLSKWVNENPRPEYATIRLIAETVGVSPSWLDDPTSADAREPEQFPEWLAARRGRAQQREHQRKRA